MIRYFRQYAWIGHKKSGDDVQTGGFIFAGSSTTGDYRAICKPRKGYDRMLPIREKYADRQGDEFFKAIICIRYYLFGWLGLVTK